MRLWVRFCVWWNYYFLRWYKWPLPMKKILCLFGHYSLSRVNPDTGELTKLWCMRCGKDLRWGRLWKDVDWSRSKLVTNYNDFTVKDFDATVEELMKAEVTYGKRERRKNRRTEKPNANA